jgi:hypothetical protein
MKNIFKLRSIAGGCLLFFFVYSSAYAAEQLVFIHQDHLGSVIAVTNEKGEFND